MREILMSEYEKRGVNSTIPEVFSLNTFLDHITKLSECLCSFYLLYRADFESDMQEVYDQMVEQVIRLSECAVPHFDRVIRLGIPLNCTPIEEEDMDFQIHMLFRDIGLLLDSVRRPKFCDHVEVSLRWENVVRTFLGLGCRIQYFLKEELV